MKFFFLNFFCPRCSLGPTKRQLRSFFEKSQHKFESLLFPSFRSHDVASCNLFSQNQTLPLLVSSDGSATQKPTYPESAETLVLKRHVERAVEHVLPKPETQIICRYIPKYCLCFLIVECCTIFLWLASITRSRSLSYVYHIFSSSWWTHLKPFNLYMKWQFLLAIFSSLQTCLINTAHICNQVNQPYAFVRNVYACVGWFFIIIIHTKPPLIKWMTIFR